MWIKLKLSTITMSFLPLVEHSLYFMFELLGKYCRYVLGFSHYKNISTLVFFVIFVLAIEYPYPLKTLYK